MKTKKLLSVFLALCMLFSCFPIVFAAEGDSNKCGDDITWTFDEATGTLTLTGTGKTYDYTYTGDPVFAEWKNNYDKIVTVIVDEGITGIGDYLFCRLSYAKSFQLPSTLTVIGNSTFYKCLALESIVIPEGVTEIKDGAFTSCWFLNDVTLPQTLTTIGDCCFDEADIHSITLPEGLKTIGEYAFDYTRLEEITIPAGVESIGQGAFFGCPLSKITNYSKTVAVMVPTNDDGNISYPGSLPFDTYEISNAAINYVLEYLKALVTNEKREDQGLTAYTNEQIFEMLQPYTTTLCEAFRLSYTIDALNAFWENFGDLSEHTYTEAADWITVYCYHNSAEVAACEACNANYVLLDSGKCGDDVTWTFDETTGTLTLTGTGATYGYEWTEPHPWDEVLNEIEHIVVDEGITELGENIFEDMEMETVSLPSTLTNIGKRAFSNCDKLTQVSVPEGITELSQGVFRMCLSLNRVDLPSSLTKICEYAFEDCEQLENVDIPDKVTEISDYAFRGCKALTKVILPSKLVTLGSECFRHCGISEITLPNSVKTIGFAAFIGSALQEITIGSEVEEIGELALYGCPLRKITNLSKTAVTIKTKQDGDCEETTVGIPGISFELAVAYMDFFTSCDVIMAKNPDATPAEIAALTKPYVDAFNEAAGTSFTTIEECIEYAENEIDIDFLTFPDYLSVYCYADSAEHEACMAYGVNHTLIDGYGYDCKCGNHCEQLNNIVPATCTERGYVGGSACSFCEVVLSKPTEILEPLGHIDNDKNGYCDRCFEPVPLEEEPEEPGGFVETLLRVVNSIVDWFRRIFSFLK